MSTARYWVGGGNWKKRSVLNPRSAQVIQDHLAESIIAPSSTDEGEK
jgi:hypothetical protein